MVPRDPGKVLRTARDRIRALADHAPSGFDAEALAQLMLWVFPRVYAVQPLQIKMRAEAGGCEFRIRPSDLLDDGRYHALAVVSKAQFEKTYLDEHLVPGETFGLAVIFCDPTGAALGTAVATLPTGERVHWPPPLTFIPDLDVVCNVIHNFIDTSPIELFAHTAGREQFRELMFCRLIPSVYEPSSQEYRKAGRAFVCEIHIGGDPVLYVLQESEATKPEMSWMFDGVEPGVTFPMVIHFGPGLGAQFAMPCFDEWPTSWVLDWLRHRPPGDACRRCGTKETKLKLCSECKGVRYCSTECQLADWRRHKKECSLLKFQCTKVNTFLM
jgi:hypothetical protein